MKKKSEVTGSNLHHLKLIVKSRRDVREIRHLIPGCSDVWILRVL